MKISIKVAALFLALSLAPHDAVCQERAEDELNGYAIHGTYQDLTVVFHALRHRKLRGQLVLPQGG